MTRPAPFGLIVVPVIVAPVVVVAVRGVTTGGTLDVGRFGLEEHGADRARDHLDHHRPRFLARRGVVGERLDDLGRKVADHHARAQQLDGERVE